MKPNGSALGCSPRCRTRPRNAPAPPRRTLVYPSQTVLTERSDARRPRLAVALLADTSFAARRPLLATSGGDARATSEEPPLSPGSNCPGVGQGSLGAVEGRRTVRAPPK